VRDLAWQFVGAVLAAPSGPARVATLNEWLLVIERLTGNLDVVPRAAARIALFTGFGCAVLAVARMPSGAVYVSASIWSVCAGLSGTVLCGYFGRLASRAAREARRDYNRLAERLMDETHVC
jgi:hypothetical protein